MKSINEQLIEWAEKYVPKFNKLSQLYQTPYYTQSPLNVIEEEVDTMIVGINPKGKLGTGESIFENPKKYLEGNPTWSSRFQEDGSISPDWGKKHRFLSGTHLFLGYDNFFHPESIDNDKKTIWTNLTPFVSDNGNNDICRELMNEGLKSTLELIQYVNPKHIVLLGIDAFSQIENNSKDSNVLIEHTTVFNNIPDQIGRINRIPTTCIVHPSSLSWGVSNKFTSMFVFLHKMAEITNEKNKIRPLNEVANIMRNEMKMWQERVVI